MFFLGNDVMEVREDGPLFQPILIIVTSLLNFFLDSAKLNSLLIFILENVAKVRFIPDFNVSFYIFQFLGNSVRSSAFNLNVPP